MIKKRQKIKELKISVFVEQMIIETPHLFQSTFYIISEKSRIFFLASRSKNDRFHVERPICIYFFHNISQKKKYVWQIYQVIYSNVWTNYFWTNIHIFLYLRYDQIYMTINLQKSEYKYFLIIFLRIQFLFNTSFSLDLYSIPKYTTHFMRSSTRDSPPKFYSRRKRCVIFSTFVLA